VGLDGFPAGTRAQWGERKQSPRDPTTYQI
jgi:hypothetical protein